MQEQQLCREQPHHKLPAQDINNAHNVSVKFSLLSVCYILFLCGQGDLLEKLGGCRNDLINVENLGCLPFTRKNQKFWLKNQLVRIISYGPFCKLWATRWDDILFVFCSVFEVHFGLL